MNETILLIALTLAIGNVFFCEFNKVNFCLRMHKLPKMIGNFSRVTLRSHKFSTKFVNYTTGVAIIYFAYYVILSKKKTKNTLSDKSDESSRTVPGTNKVNAFGIKRAKISFYG